MKIPWMYAQNTFLNCTTGSFRKGVRISIFHDAALDAAKTNPFFLALFNAYHPLHLALLEAYSTWKTSTNAQEGLTLAVENLIETLSGTKIRDWHVAVQVVFNITTDEYKAIFPNNRSPFQTGSQSDRLLAVKSLSKALEHIESLTAVKASIDEFYTLLNNAMSALNGGISTISDNRSEVEKARVAMCVEQYTNVGALIQKFAATPEEISKYFDLKAIRTSAQSIFTGQLKAGEAHTVAKHTFKADDDVVLDNPGTTDLLYWLASHKDSPIGALFVTVPAGQTLTLTAKEIGNIPNLYLMVQNASSVAGGEFEVEI